MLHSIPFKRESSYNDHVRFEVERMVAGYARDPDHGCPAEGVDCAGPLAGNGQLPCPTCCDATRTENLDEFDVWKTVVAPDQDREQNQAQASVEGAASATAEASR